MGMYTELVINCRIPADQTDAAHALANWGQVKLDHPLFQAPRWDHIGSMIGQCFATKLSWLKLEKHDYDWDDGEYSLAIRCSFKNYGGEVELFIDWLQSIGAEGSGDRGFIGYWMYEEDDEPTLIYLERRGS